MLVKRINEIARVRRGASPRPIDDPKYFGGEVGWVRIADVSASNKYLRYTTQYVSKLGESLSVRVNKGDLILSIAGTVGRPIIIDMPACIHDGFVQIYDLKNTNTEFLYYYLKFLEKSLTRFGQSGTQTNLNSQIVGNIELNFFPEKEQIAIARILSTADRAIAQTEALIAKYQRIKTGLMQDLLTKGIDAQGNIRSKATHRFVVKEGVEVPEEWEVDTIGKHLESIEQGWSPDCESDPAPTNEWGVLKTTAVTWNGYNEDENKKMPEKLIPKKQYEIQAGDVLITRAGPNSRVGVVAFVKETRAKLILSDKIYRLKTKKGLLPEFLALVLSSSNTQRHLSTMKTGMAESQTNISQKIVSELLITIPKPWEQSMILERLNAINNSLKKLENCLNKDLSTKVGLMQDLLSGKISVNL